MSDDIRNMMLEDTKDLLDNIEITDIATQCKLLKDKEDEKLLWKRNGQKKSIKQNIGNGIGAIAVTPAVA